MRRRRGEQEIAYERGEVPRGLRRRNGGLYGCSEFKRETVAQSHWLAPATSVPRYGVQTHKLPSFPFVVVYTS